MDQHTLVIGLIFISFFLAISSLLQTISNKYPVPYTVGLLLAGLITQQTVHFLHLDVHLSLSPQIIYYILLPLLLFESAFHINIHQFKLQFKTITWLSTFGLLVSLFIIGFGVAYLLGLPLGVGLLFGALISATDPIAVIALFKTLGAPKRLTLVADGESMFNDATAVIAFRVISTFVLAGTAFEAGKILESTGDFLYIFIGSIVFGVLSGFITSKIVALVKNDRVVENTLALALAVFSFVGAEHFFHLSGVISTVMAAVVFGNLGKTKISAPVYPFIEQWWEYVAFLCVSLVFFFAAFNLDFEIFAHNPGSLVIVIALVLIARAVSVYLSAWISNNWSFFKDEPKMPMSWQHILNWGGLRGVIPLVLVYSLPDTFEYKNQVLAFTLSTLLFTLIVNGLTIRWLLLKLGLHLPKREEEIVHDEMEIFGLESSKERLKKLPRREFDAAILNKVSTSLVKTEQDRKKHLMEISTPNEFLQSLRLQALEIERETLHNFYRQGRFSEGVFYQFESELDLQQDQLEYPNMFKAGENKAQAPAKSYRQRIMKFRRFATNYPVLSKLFGGSEIDIVTERYGLLRARLFTSYAVLDYLSSVEKIFSNREFIKAIKQVRIKYETLIKKNQKETEKLTKTYPEVAKGYQERIVSALITPEPAFSSAH